MLIMKMRNALKLKEMVTKTKESCDGHIFGIQVTDYWNLGVILCIHVTPNPQQEKVKILIAVAFLLLLLKKSNQFIKTSNLKKRWDVRCKCDPNVCE